MLISSKDKNPIRSNINIDFAYGIENLSYVQAVSPEIYAFTTIQGESVTIRGVIFSKFFKLQGGEIISGSNPRNLFDALIGVNAEKRFNLRIGEQLTLRGSFLSSIAIVNITGVFKTDSPADDEILVSIPTAEKLAGIRPGMVSVVRIKTDDSYKIRELLDPNTPKFMVHLNTTHTGYAHQRINVNATIINEGANGGNCELHILFENHTKNFKFYVSKEKKIQFNLTLNEIGTQNITATVKNDIFYYTCHTEISVFPKPVYMQGPSVAFPKTPVTYTFKTIHNESIENGTLLVNGYDFEKEYHVHGSVNVTYPHAGKYSLFFSGDEYESDTFNVSVYKRVNMSEIALIEPQPINGTIFANSTDKINIFTGGEVYYSIDGGSPIEGDTISLSSKLYGNHVLNVTVISGEDMAVESYTLHVFENYKPVIISSQNYSKLMYGSIIKYIFSDPAPIKNSTLWINNERYDYKINQHLNASVANYTYSINVTVNRTPTMNVFLYFMDAWGRSATYHATYQVFLEHDIEKPEIDVPAEIKIWGGNTTVVKATDNVAVSNITVYVDWPYPQKFFKSNGDTVDVPTCFIYSDRVVFVSEGTYHAHVVAYDTSGNRNEADFTIIVNNSGEKNPPILIGNETTKGYYDLSKGWIKFTAYDNVAVENVSIYEKQGSTWKLKKYVQGDRENMSIYLNSSDLTNGLHYLAVGAYDVNLIFMEYHYITVIKNYVDAEKPKIDVPAEIKIWGGNTTVVKATDNVAVSNITVHVNWPYPQKFFNSSGNKSSLSDVIHTDFDENGKIVYAGEGIYNATIVVYDVSGNRNETNFTIIVNNSGEKNPPMFTIEDYISMGFLQNVTIPAYDNVAVVKMWITNSTGTVEENYGGSITLYGKLLRIGFNSLTVHAEDINGNLAYKEITVLVYDDVKPWLTVDEVKIWGGNKTYITAKDNVQVSKISAYFQDTYYNASGNQIEVPTMFMNDTAVVFLKDGDYPVSVKIWDASGNINTTVFHIIVNNSGEKNPPIILGKDYGVINISSSLSYHSFDNVGVKKMWVYDGKRIVKEVNDSVINLTCDDLPAGEHNLTIYAEDVNGNIGYKKITVNVAGIKKVDVNVHLLKNKIKENENDVIEVNIVNGNTEGYYNLTVFIDGEIYYSSKILLHPYERKDVSIELPQLSVGNHTLKIANESMRLEVLKKSSENIPTDLILKYAKNMKFSESKNVIYKGFQISEGNFILLLLSLIIITLILLFLGLYSSVLKGIKNQNIGILRAIGANNRQIFIYFMGDSIKYVFVPIGLGLIGGYLFIISVNSLGILTALGHRLIIAPTFKDILMILAISLTFAAIDLLMIFRSLMKKRVIHHILGSEESVVPVRLEDVIGSE